MQISDLLLSSQILLLPICNDSSFPDSSGNKFMVKKNGYHQLAALFSYPIDDAIFLIVVLLKFPMYFHLRFLSTIDGVV